MQLLNLQFQPGQFSVTLSRFQQPRRASGQSEYPARISRDENLGVIGDANYPAHDCADTFTGVLKWLSQLQISLIKFDKIFIFAITHIMISQSRRHIFFGKRVHLDHSVLPTHENIHAVLQLVGIQWSNSRARRSQQPSDSERFIALKDQQSNPTVCGANENAILWLCISFPKVSCDRVKLDMTNL